MSEHDEFLKGFCDGSGLQGEAAVQAYAKWLEGEGANEVERIDLESGGYEMGLEIGKDWKLTNN